MRYFFLLSFLLFTLKAYSQTNTIPIVKSQLETTSDLKEQVRLLCELSKLHSNTSVSSSLTYANKAVQLAKEINYPNGLALAYNHIGIAYDKAGEYNSAAEYYYKSLRIREDIKDSIGLSSSYINIGSIYNIQNNLKKATEFYDKALKIAVVLNDTITIAKTYNNLGSVYQKKKDPEKALDYILKGLELKQHLGDKESIILSLNNVGYIYSDLEQWDNAIAYHEKAFKLLKHQKKSLNTAYSLYGLAQAYLYKGIPNRALPYAMQNMQVVQSLKSKDEIRLAAELLNDIYLKLGNYKNAHHYLTLYKQYGDSINAIETSTKIAKLQLQYEKKRAEHENKLLKAEHNLQKQTLNRQTTFQYLTMLLLLMAIVLAVVFFMGRLRLRKMNALLIQRNNEVLKHSSELSQKQEELKEQSELLLKQKAELEKLNDVKDKLFSIIAHDLRSPLVSLKGLLHIYAKGAVPPEKMNVFITSIDKSQQNALWLLDNLLLWAKAQMNGLKVEKEEIYITKLIDQNIKLLQEQADSKGINLSYNVNPELRFFADKEMTDLVIRNLVSNAIKFCSKGDTIEITAEDKKDNIIIKISDTGIGILPEKLDTLFSGIINSSNPGTANEKGSGLGLPLCKYFIEQNGGQIWANSELGTGSTFNFSLPAMQADMKATIVKEEMEMA